VPRDLPLDGLSPADLAKLGLGDFNMERSMNAQWLGVLRHALTTIGAVLMTMGFVDEGMWATVSGAILTLVPTVWSWYSNRMTSLVSEVAASDTVKEVVMVNSTLANADPNPKVVSP
jgi:hypothetical protein